MAKLLLYDAKFKDAPAVAAIWHVGLTELQAIKTLDDLARAIGKHKELDELVLYVHGFTGGMMLDHQGFALDDLPVKTALTKKKTKIDIIRFEGCWVGESPSLMAQFGGYFDAWTVSGYTWAHWVAPLTVTIPKQAKVKTLQGLMKDTERWLAPGTPTLVQLASMAQNGPIKKSLTMEWYEYTILEGKPPYATERGQTKTNLERFGSHKYKRRSEATPRIVQAKDTDTESDTSVNPIPPFEYVTVKLREVTLKDI